MKDSLYRKAMEKDIKDVLSAVMLLGFSLAFMLLGGVTLLVLACLVAFGDLVAPYSALIAAIVLGLGLLMGNLAERIAKTAGE